MDVSLGLTESSCRPRDVGREKTTGVTGADPSGGCSKDVSDD